MDRFICDGSACFGYSCYSFLQAISLAYIYMHTIFDTKKAMFNAFMYLVVYRKHIDICGVIMYPCNYFAAVIFKIGKFSMIYLAFYVLNYVFLLNCKNNYLMQVTLSTILFLWHDAFPVTFLKFMSSKSLC